MTQKLNKTSLSKLLSFVLRHDPGSIGLTLDRGGWADVDDLLDKAGHQITRSELETVVQTSDKQRFALSSDGRRIRANQGHSIDVDLGLLAACPPDVLFHGTVQKFLSAILEHGLTPQARHHVHLSADTATAQSVGARRGTPIVLRINAKAMHEAGHLFYRSQNGVWLTDHVPASFLMPS